MLNRISENLTNDNIYIRPKFLLYKIFKKKKNIYKCVHRYKHFMALR